jgi:hypothetical protein
VFIEILRHVATTNMITVYVICIYNLFVFCAGILKRLVPCIRQGSSPLSGRKIKESKTQVWTGAQLEALIEEDRREELLDIRRMMLEDDSISKEPEEGRNLCLCVHYS